MAIRTVLGERTPESLGPVLPHEHLICDFSRVSEQPNQVLNEVDLAVDELRALTEAGGTCLVELTTPDLGRNPAALREISVRSGVAIVMGTGWYVEPFYPPEIDTATVEHLTERIVGDLTEGVAVDDGAPVKAGIIGEVGAYRAHLSAQEERVLRASARASNATGAPVSTHAFQHPVGLAQVQLLREEGVNPSRIVVGHVDTYLDLEYHRALLRQGVYIQYDSCGRDHLNPDTRRAQYLLQLIREGWTERLLLSSDRCYRTDLLAFGGKGYAWTLTGFCSLLRDLGVSEEEIDTLTRHNPLRVLDW